MADLLVVQAARADEDDYVDWAPVHLRAVRVRRMSGLGGWVCTGVLKQWIGGSYACVDRQCAKHGYQLRKGDTGMENERNKPQEESRKENFIEKAWHGVDDSAKASPGPESSRQAAGCAVDSGKVAGVLKESASDPLDQRRHRINRVRALAQMFGHNSHPDSGNWLMDVAYRLEELEILCEKRPVEIIQEIGRELETVRSQRSNLADEMIMLRKQFSALNASFDVATARRNELAQLSITLTDQLRESRFKNETLQRQLHAERQAAAEQQAKRKQFDRATIDALSVDISDAKVALNRHHDS